MPIEWTVFKVGRLKDLVAMGMSNPDISAKMSLEFGETIGIKAVEQAKYRQGFSSHCVPIDKQIKFYEAKTIPDKNCMVSCDYHAPYYSEVYVNRLLAVADKFGIREHVIIGDLFDMDFAKKYYDDEGSSWDKEALHTDPLIQALGFFDLNWLIRGNHEKRVGISTESRIQARHLFGIFGKDVWEKKFRYSPYDKMFMGKQWLFVHPRSYSQISGSVAIRLAEKYHRHVLNSHGHFVALRYDRSGKYMGVDTGGMFDRKKIKYINETTTTHPLWNNGFGMIYEGHFYHFHEQSDWRYWLGSESA